MKVTIDSNLQISNQFEPPLELVLEDDSRTLNDVLGKLSNMCHPFELLKKIVDWDAISMSYSSMEKAIFL